MGTAYRSQSRDTTRDAEEIQFAHWREMTLIEKARAFTSLMSMAEQLALAGIRLRHPDADAREIRIRLLALRLDRETMIRFFDWDPEREGY